jgi:hypothetical protein
MATRDYKKEYKRDLETGKSGPGSDQSERQRARKLYDKLGVDRAGKDARVARRPPAICD